MLHYQGIDGAGTFRSERTDAETVKRLVRRLFYVAKWSELTVTQDGRAVGGIKVERSGRSSFRRPWWAD